MQNKGLIRFLAIAFILVCVFQLTFTLRTRSVEKHARKYATAQVEAPAAQNYINKVAASNADYAQTLRDSIYTSSESYYLDSMATVKVLYGYTYRQCQSREINLGLDLKGGMNVMVEVSTVDVVRALANHTDDSVFNAAIKKALAKQKTTTNRDFVSLFYDAIREINPQVELAPYFNAQLRDRIKLGDDNEAVIKIVKEETDGAYDRTYEILRKRIDKFGVAQPTIQKLEASERILVELPGVKDPERVRKLLQGTAQLEFWLTYECNEALPILERVDSYAAGHVDEEVAENTEEEKNDTTVVAVAGDDSILNALSSDNTEGAENEALSRNAKDHPIFALMDANVDPQSGQYGVGPVVGYAPEKNKAAIDRMIKDAEAKNIIDRRSIRFLWAAKPIKEGTDIYALYAIKVNPRDTNALLDGGVITDARQDFSNVGGNEISMTMNNSGAEKWKRITGNNIGKCVAIVLDDIVYSAPVVRSEIAGGRSSITGDFTLEEAKDLANILKSGKLPAPAVIVQEAVVGPSLGQESIHKGLISFILAFIIVLLYMVVFYNRAGWVSTVALITNVFLLMGVLASIGAVLTLPGIAGIVLTMAMAVDGNVIIYERIKEELRAGSSMSNAIDNGFKNAYSAIIDGQVTTFLLGLVLIMFGSGPVQGFAVTLCIGIVTSLFTSIFITRLVLDWMLNSHKKIKFSYPFTENFMQNAKINFIGNRKTYYIIGCCAILICFLSIGIRHLNRGIDFTGGRTYVVRFDQNVSANDVRASLAKQFEEAPEVKTYGPSRQLKITTKYKYDKDGDEVKNEITQKLYDGTKDYFANKNITIEDFRSTETTPLGIIQSEQVGATIAHDLIRNSILSVIGGLLIIFVYVAIRFRNWKFGIGSVAALAHDTILVIGMFALLHGLLPFNLEVDQSFIAAVLTVIGYSINATVVIFDRVREFKKLYPKRDLHTHMNDAINSTLARTINTSGTTFFTLLMMFIFGGEVIRGFIFALLVGVLCGVFSSVCIACPLVYDIEMARERRKLAKAGAVAKA
ncbi:MAG: protein translocase subunit SecDF [Bacteroidales bacterium]|nr:protein translocase subunit SecDF [Bacteroidales bacterium]